jgi:hypothetical protein
MREKAKNTMNRLRESMSPDEQAKMQEKEKIGRKILRNGMSSDEIGQNKGERNNCKEEIDGWHLS